MRGSHDGSWETMHERVAGRSWPVGRPEEVYDLVIVGAGISGLSAAYFHRAADPGARILVLDNHDDFGGHARRNEFQVAGRTLISHGGSQTLQEPAQYSDITKGLLRDLGVDTKRLSLIHI